MKSSTLFRHLTALLACMLLGACASSTMDSVPDEAKLEQYKNAARSSFQGEYARLITERDSGFLTQAQYSEQVNRLEERVVQKAHTLAWESHQMAELERAAQGVPTPAAPQMLNAPSAMRGGAGGSSNYRSSLNQYNNMSGVGGASSMTSSQLNTGGSYNGSGALSTPNYPGSIYDGNQ